MSTDKRSLVDSAGTEMFWATTLIIAMLISIALALGLFIAGRI